MKNTKEDLVASQRSDTLKGAQLATEQLARQAADKRATDAEGNLAKLAEVKDEERGLVITLSGSVLFASNKATLLPAARTRPDQVSEALMATKERKLTIEGDTDSQGSSSHNKDLSQRAQTQSTRIS
jgi:outer membrane protein OmpA-like peptidoglycan-associated protein